ncbi:MAG: hypothetical protein IPK85_09145 [Gemmatimonadetes bacterium]|nr:hypothetical protein [Gemmatimonadota bacterium]
MLALIIAGIVAAVLASPVARGAAGILVVGLAVAAVAERRSREAMRTLRVGEDIGTFARALDRRDPAFDPWVVRAVWDALRGGYERAGWEMPLRPGGPWRADLGIDGEDLEFDVLPTVTTRTFRSFTWEDVHANPMYDRVDTVADLIQFVALQPRRAA